MEWMWMTDLMMMTSACHYSSKVIEVAFAAAEKADGGEMGLDWDGEEILGVLRSYGSCETNKEIFLPKHIGICALAC